MSFTLQFALQLSKQLGMVHLQIVHARSLCWPAFGRKDDTLGRIGLGDNVKVDVVYFLVC